MHHPVRYPKGCCSVDPRLIDRLETMVDCRTEAAVNAQFGISYNTWRKLIAGQPVRASLLSRLQARIDRLDTPPRA